MNKDLCTIPTCQNYQRYCRIHLSSEIKPIKPLNKNSDERTIINRKYNQEARKFITTHAVCGVCKKHKSTQVHHKAGKIGENLMDKSKWLALCGLCHRKITDDSAWAIDNGYSESRLGVQEIQIVNA